MLFNSWIFIGFLAIVFGLYYLVPLLRLNLRYQVLLLFVSSLVFYAYDRPSLLLLLLVSLTLNATIAIQISRHAENRRQSARWVAVGVVLNLALLGWFKYASLLVGPLLSQVLGIDIREDLASIPLPVGISFYTFQAISLLVDLHRSDEPGVQALKVSMKSNRVRRSVLDIGFYIAFFPQLVAGPIVKASEFMGQIGGKWIKNIHWVTVITCLVIGYFLKMVVADNLKDVTNLLSAGNLQVLGKLDLIALLYGYSFQIFADFAGYSLIAIGLGALFGYRFPINFNYPYISASVTEFWQRWHISLSSFLRDYLYVPLGGNRKGASRTYLNLAIVMFLGGLWHGAAWSYAIWGLSHGVLLAVERLFRNRAKASDQRKRSWLLHVGQIVVTFHVVSLLWLLFLLPDFSQVIEYFKVLWSGHVLLTSFQNLYIVFLYSLPILAYHLDAFLLQYQSRGLYVRFLRPHLKVPMLALMLVAIILNSGTSGDFIYFQF